MSTRSVLQAAVADLATVPAVSRWVVSGGVRLHTLDYGGEGTPVLVLPGITSPAISFDFVATQIRDHARVIVVDARGRGFSDNGDSYSLESYADDTEALIAGLQLERPVLLGHSMGARIAAVTAARGKSNVRGLILVDPPLSGPTRGPYPTALSTFLSELHRAQAGVTADELAVNWPRWPRRELELRSRWLATCDETAVAESHEGLEEEDFFEVWPSLKLPTTMIYGADSPVVTAEGAQEASQLNPDAELLSVPGAGHMVFWDNPAEGIEKLKSTLLSHLSSSSF